MPSVSLMRSEDSMPDIWRMNHNWTVSRASIDRKSLARQRLLRPQRDIDKKASGHTLTWSDYSSEMETFPEGPKRVTDSEEKTTWRVHHWRHRHLCHQDDQKCTDGGTSTWQQLGQQVEKSEHSRAYFTLFVSFHAGAVSWAEWVSPWLMFTVQQSLSVFAGVVHFAHAILVPICRQRSLQVSTHIST